MFTSVLVYSLSSSPDTRSKSLQRSRAAESNESRYSVSASLPYHYYRRFVPEFDCLSSICLLGVLSTYLFLHLCVCSCVPILVIFVLTFPILFFVLFFDHVFQSLFNLWCVSLDVIFIYQSINQPTNQSINQSLLTCHMHSPRTNCPIRHTALYIMTRNGNQFSNQTLSHHFN